MWSKITSFIIIVHIIIFPQYGAVGAEDDKHRRFPDGFKFGVSTSAYQIEGAWNISGKGESIWDRFVHTTNLVSDGSTGDEACDSYHQYERDVEMLKELGVNFYRFSLSWSRILPNGFDNKINEEGVAYYNKLIDLLIQNSIQPVITLYHFDFPQVLQDIGGWANPLMEKYFADFARVCFEQFGDRVRHWLTFNEPAIFCFFGYASKEAPPAINLPGIGDYLCAHTVIKSHARVYHIYDEEYRPSQNGRISIALNGCWFEPEDRECPDDLLASELGLQFEIGWFAHPIFSDEGDYPEVMKTNIAWKSTQQGFSSSRLPQFTAEEIQYIKGTYDFFGLNHYTTGMVRLSLNSGQTSPSFDDDRGTVRYSNKDWPFSQNNPDLFMVPWGFRKVLNWIKDSYRNPEVIVFENGFPDSSDIRDVERIEYLQEYINTMLDAVEDGCHISGYAVWSLMDSFEWISGYREKFGLYSVDFNSTNKTRTIKASGHYFAEIVKARSIGKYLDPNTNNI